MSLEANDVQSDCEDLIEEDFSLPADIISERTPRRKQSSGKPPSSQRSPYLCSLDLSSKRSSMGTWRRPRVSLGETRGDNSGESVSACLTSLSNGHDGSHTLTSEAEQKPSIRKHRSLHFESNGFTAGVGEHMKKEDMYDEIIRLKKSLHSQKSDNQQMKVKLRRLEEENAKRERQIEELLDPTKGSEYTHSLVDKKREGSVVVNGLKQRILKLEQQCREKGNALSKLQSELRTTSLEELKITVETYFEEIQRLRMLLEAAEKSSRAESKCSQRQQKVLSSTVQRLAENLKQLQQENAALREELNTDSPAGGIKGYREWSKQRLLRRLLELEKRLGSSRRHAQSAKSSTRLDKEVQATLTAAPRFTMATEMAVSVGTVTEEAEEISGQSNHLSQLEKDKVELQELLSCKDEELSQLRAERDELQRQTQRLKAEHKQQMDHKKQQHRQELEHLRTRSQTLEEERNKLVTAELSSPPPPPPGSAAPGGWGGPSAPESDVYLSCVVAQKAKVLDAHLPSLKKRKLDEGGGASGMAKICISYEGEVPESQRRPANLLDALDQGERRRGDDDAAGGDEASRLSTLSLQYNKRLEDELRGGKRKIKLVHEQKTSTSEDVLEDGKTSRAKQFLADMKASLSKVTFDRIVQALQDYKKTDSLDSLLSETSMLADDENTHSLLRGFYQFIRPHHKKRFDEKCLELTGQGCGFKPDHSLSKDEKRAVMLQKPSERQPAEARSSSSSCRQLDTQQLNGGGPHLSQQGLKQPQEGAGSAKGNKVYAALIADVKEAFGAEKSSLLFQAVRRYKETDVYEDLVTTLVNMFMETWEHFDLLIRFGTFVRPHHKKLYKEMLDALIFSAARDPSLKEEQEKRAPLLPPFKTQSKISTFFSTNKDDI
uniref:IQ motif containing E n=1 Tax=Nothobranchius kuhntae TaxID=321403 RepID=A0A1A8JT35_NOTKU